MSAQVESTTDAGFETDVLSQPVPVLVDFWAEWCGPCRLLGPVLDSLAESHGDRLRIVKLNVDENPGTAERYGVRSIPTMLLYREGEVAKTIVGVRPKTALLAELEPFLGSDGS